jgi:hypothetical protein
MVEPKSPPKQSLDGAASYPDAWVKKAVIEVIPWAKRLIRLL